MLNKSLLLCKPRVIEDVPAQACARPWGRGASVGGGTYHGAPFRGIDGWVEPHAGVYDRLVQRGDLKIVAVMV